MGEVDTCWRWWYLEDNETSSVMMFTFEHINKNPGLDSVLKALKLHREKTYGALPPSDSFKKPLWMWSLKKERMNFAHGSPIDYDIFVSSTKNQKKPDTIVPMGKMKQGFLSMSKDDWNIVFQRGQTLSLSAQHPTLSMLLWIDTKP